MTETLVPAPILLLLSHPWFGSNYDLPRFEKLRALSVLYPNQTHSPAQFDFCEKQVFVNANNLETLGEKVMRLLN